MTRLHLANRAPLHLFRQTMKMNRLLSLLACGVFSRNTEPPAGYGQSRQLNPNPDQFSESPKQHEGDAGDIGVSKCFQQEQIPAVLDSKAAGIKKAAFDKDRERADGEAEGEG